MITPMNGAQLGRFAEGMLDDLMRIGSYLDHQPRLLGDLESAGRTAERLTTRLADAPALRALHALNPEISRAVTGSGLGMERFAAAVRTQHGAITTDAESIARVHVNSLRQAAMETIAALAR